MDSIKLTSGTFKFLEKTLSSSVLLYTLPSGKRYIVKRASHSRLRNEYDILSQLSHPNIIKVYDYGYDFINKHYMISQYCEQGDMISFLTINFAKILNKSNILSQKFEKFWRFVFLSVLDVLLYLNTKNLAHLDVKPENLLMTEDFTVKLCDFELVFSTKREGITQECSLIAGTQIYYSPEIIEKNVPYNAVKSEIFSFAITMLNMITGSQIFNKETSNDFRYKLIKSEKFDEFWASVKYTRFLTADLKDLMMKMLKFDPNERIALEDIKGHRWCLEGILEKNEIRELFMGL